MPRDDLHAPRPVRLRRDRLTLIHRPQTITQPRTITVARLPSARPQKAHAPVARISYTDTRSGSTFPARSHAIAAATAASIHMNRLPFGFTNLQR